MWISRDKEKEGEYYIAFWIDNPIVDGDWFYDRRGSCSMGLLYFDKWIKCGGFDIYPGECYQVDIIKVEEDQQATKIWISRDKDKNRQYCVDMWSNYPILDNENFVFCNHISDMTVLKYSEWIDSNGFKIEPGECYQIDIVKKKEIS